MKELDNIITTYTASGKLMLFGEYLVLKGSNCLAFPLKFGQTLSVENANHFLWESYSKHGLWFSMTMDEDFKIIETNNKEVAKTLQQLFRVIHSERPELDCKKHFTIKADFDLDWGLGSSSTLISLLSQWSGVVPKKLLNASFGGSGYDVACATANYPIVYSNNTQKEVQISNMITDKMLFVYLGKKQNSRDEVLRFDTIEVSPKDIQVINTIIEESLKAENIEEFEQLLNDADQLIASIIGMPRLKQKSFPDYSYSTKYLGAWGGDFFLATFRNLEKAKSYFKKKGYDTMFTYNELIK